MKRSTYVVGAALLASCGAAGAIYASGTASADTERGGSDPFAWTLELNQAVASLGVSVGTAGDVNGDGYSDVIVGANRWTGTFSQAGRALIYAGGPDGIGGPALWSQEGFGVFARYGTSVSTAGDVNGDGYDDVLVGAPLADDGVREPDEGWAYLYYGSASGPSTSAGWKGEGNETGAQYGTSVAYAGDVNRDGFADFLVGAPAAGSPDVGRAYLYLGGAGGPTLAPGWPVSGTQVDAQLGRCVAGAGDVNGDGFDDVLVGQPYYDAGTFFPDRGRVLCYHGDGSGVGTIPVWDDPGPTANAHYGQALGTAGDVNGDGFADVILGAPGAALDEGQVEIFAGSAAGLADTALFVGHGSHQGVDYGWSVATAGDYNGDGFADVLIGAAEYDRIELYIGGPEGVTYGFVEIASPETAFGWSVATAGDVNGDGLSDWIVGAPDYSSGQTFEGWVGVARGYAIHPTYAGAGFVFGTTPGASFGRSVAASGDLNGDGYDDVVVGAPSFDDAEADVGRILAFTGSPTGLDQSPTSTHAGTVAGGRLGTSLAYAGDVNGDGYADVVAGAPDASLAYGYYGSATGLPAIPDWTVTHTQADARFGWSVAGAGDVNGDGYADVIVGAPDADDGFVDQGSAQLFLGSPSGLATSPIVTLFGEAAGDHFGYAVAGVGDISSNGLDDFLVGAPDFDDPLDGVDAGGAYLYTYAIPDGDWRWRLSGLGPGERFGIALASLGDFDADGYGDFFVASENNSNDYVHIYQGSSNEVLDLMLVPSLNEVTSLVACDWDRDGRSDPFLGSPSSGNVLGGPATLVAPNMPFSAFYGGALGLGRSVSAGDVDGDGYPDIVAGNPNFILVSPDDGIIRIFYGNTRDALPDGMGFFPQARSSTSVPIALQGLAPDIDAVTLSMTGRSAAGRSHVRLEWQVEPMGTPYTSTPNAGAWTLTSDPDTIGSAVPLSAPVTGLTADTRYRWRVRAAARNPLFPRTPWLTNAPTSHAMWHLRTAPLVVAVEEGQSMPSLLMRHAHPNPFRSSTTVTFVLDAAETARADVVDVSGRRVAQLFDGRLPAGEHRIQWDGRSDAGRETAAGVYFVRLRAGDREQVQRLVRVR